MTALDPDHVAVLARQLHDLTCLLADQPFTKIGKQHRANHERTARRFLSGLHNGGYQLCTREN